MNAPFIYHIMIDRFAGADPKRQGRCFKGGTLHAIIPKLSYIQGLGCTGIMLTPFYKTHEYHGYHVLDYEQVDEHFGTWQDVTDLVDAVHRRGMTITADFVANHCHISNRLCSEHPDWFKMDKAGKLQCFAGIDTLPEFNLDNPAACRYMIERGKDLCRCGFDAIRLDYAKGPSSQFWRKFRKALKADFPHVLLIGEVWGKPDEKRLTAELAKAFREKRMTQQDAWQQRYIGIFDGVFDFEYQSLLCKAAKSGKGFTENPELKDTIERHFNHYIHSPDFQLWLFLDNHDTNRFLYECGNDVEALQAAIHFTRNQQRPFLLYYGTERGMTNKTDVFGGTPYADEHVRECMKWRKTVLTF